MSIPANARTRIRARTSARTQRGMAGSEASSLGKQRRQAAMAAAAVLW